MLILPVVLALVMAALSAATWLYARDVALNAARQGLAAARDQGSSASAGVPAAEAFARQNGGGFLTGVHASAAMSGGQVPTVTVTVTGRALSVIPFWHQDVIQSAQAPLEMFSTPESHS